VKILAGAKGVVFLTVVKGGFVVGGSVGTGIIITRNAKYGWSGPCAVGLAGFQWGFNIGVQKIENIIVLHDDLSLKTFCGKGQFKLGIDASIAAGPKGRNAEVALSVNDKRYAPTLSYSMSKGIYLGISLEGQAIAVRNDCNEDFYQQKIQPDKILDGSIQPPNNNEDYSAICNMLDEYATTEGKSEKDEFINANDNNIQLSKQQPPKEEQKEDGKN